MISKRCELSIPTKKLDNLQMKVRDEVIHFLKTRENFQQTCPVCEKSNYREVAKVDRLGIPANFVFCTRCSCIFQLKQYSEETYYTNYQQYSKKMRKKSTEDEDQDFLKRVENLSRKRYELIKSKIQLAPGSLVVELGAYDGANLWPFYQDAYQCIGVEIDPNAIKPGVSRGIHFERTNISEWLNHKNNNNEKTDLIILSHVLGHLHHPKKIINDIHHILSDNGYVYIEMPSYLNPANINSVVGCLPYLDFEQLFSMHQRLLIYFFEGIGFKEIYSDQSCQAIFQKIEQPLSTKNPTDVEAAWNYVVNCETEYLNSWRGKVKEIKRRIF